MSLRYYAILQMCQTCTRPKMLVSQGTLWFYVVQKALGVAPYMMSKGKYFVAHYMNIQTLIGTCLMATYIILGLQKVVMIPGKVFESYITISVATLSLLHVMARQKAAVDANNEIVAVSATLAKYTNINYQKLLALRIMEFLFSAGLVVGISIFLVKSSPHSEWYSCMGMIYSMVVRVLLVNHFLWLVYAVKINVTAVNALLDNEALYVSEDLIEIADLQERLTGCGGNTNDAFSMPLLCWCIESFAKICYSSYHLTICILYPKFPTCGPEKNQSFFTFLWYLIQLWYMITLCQMTAITAMATTKRIHRKLREVKSSDAIMEKKLQCRYSSYQNSKKVGNTEEYTSKFEITRSPEDWKYVERLLAPGVVPNPGQKESYPSNWKPPSDSARNGPYFVPRNRNHMIPVYLNSTHRGMRKITEITKIQGDVFELENELKQHLKTAVGRAVATQVNELVGYIHIKGDHVNVVKEFLMEKGF